MKYKFLVVHGNERQTKWMQACDVFESWKVLGIQDIMTVEFKDGITADDDRIDSLKKALELAGEVVSFIFMFDSKSYWRNPDVKVVSNGNSWILLNEIIDKYLVTEKV